MTKFSNVPLVFIDLSLEDQLRELRQYFNELGADIDDHPSAKGLEDDVRQIISVCDICFTSKQIDAMEKTLNALVSILVMIPIDRAAPMILQFVQKMGQVEEAKLWPVMLRVMWVLLDAVNAHSIVKYYVYCELIRTATKLNQVHEVFQGLDALEKTMADCPMTNEERRNLLRLVYEPLFASRASEQARSVMMEILSTYTKPQSPEALSDAKRLVLNAIADPKTFIYEPLLNIKPIQALEGDLIYDLLMIFVRGNLQEYIEFHEANPTFFAANEHIFTHSQNLQKMKFLSFFSISKDHTEVDFETVQTQLDLREENVEEFVVSAIKTGQIHARIDQKAKKIHVSRCIQRTFGTDQWHQLHSKLTMLKSSLVKICSNLALIKDEMAHSCEV